MDRLERVRMEVDRLIEQLREEHDRKFAYIHLYGVSQFAAMLAIQRQVDSELCAIAAMLHDISMVATNSGRNDHAKKSAEVAKGILEELALFQEDEIKRIVYAIQVHSDKSNKSDGSLAEVLKDADVLAHYLYNPQIPIGEHDRVRLYYLLEMIKGESKKKPDV